MPSSGQVWFGKVIIDPWVLSLVFQPTQTFETLKLMIWKTTSTTFPIFLNISSSLVRIKLNNKNQPPSLLNSGDCYEESFNLGFGR